MPTADDPPGLSLPGFRTFFERACPGAVAGPLRGWLIVGGKSNLTYEVTDGVTSWIVRRPPLGHVLATAHDMTREHTVMAALADTDVPVPAMLALCTDPDVIGAPFYVMAKFAGTPYRTAAQLIPLGARRTRRISTRMVDVLVALHAIDPDSVGLNAFGRPTGFLARQVRRWKTQLDGSRGRPLTGADELYERLRADLPAESAPAIVHGDYRLDNLLVDETDTITAVLDWEMATLGDPLTDLALLVVYRRLADMDTAGAVADAARTPGFLSEREILDRYAERSGRDFSDIGFHLGLAYFKLATILEGIHFRHTQGQTVGEGFAGIGALVEPLFEAGLTATKECT